MRLRVEIDPSSEGEIIIRAPRVDDELQRLQKEISESISGRGEISLFCGDEEHFVSFDKLIFFETYDGKVRAHTADMMFTSHLKLFELEQLLPRSFARASKSCLANIHEVSSISKSLTGASEVRFKGTYKKIYVSRMYYKSFHDMINETRLKK